MITRIPRRWASSTSRSNSASLPNSGSMAVWSLMS